VAHCLLNQNARAEGLVKGWPALVWDLMKLVKNHRVGLEQLPCPELITYGCSREPATKDDYDKPEFRKRCCELSKEVVRQAKFFKKAGHRVLGLVGAAGSPTCGVGETHRAHLRQRIEEPGIFIEELKKILEIPMVDFDFRNVEKSLERVEKLLAWRC